MALSKRTLLILGIVLLQALTIGALVTALSWKETKSGSSSVADLQPYVEGDLSPQVRDLMPRPLDSAHDIIKNSSYISSSSLKSYLEFFPDDFSTVLFSLGPDRQIVDAGAGDAYFLEQYVSAQADPDPRRLLRPSLRAPFQKFLHKPLRSRANVVGIDLEQRRADIPDYHGKFRMLTGRLFENIPDSEIGKTDLLIDCLGVLAYTPELHIALEKTLRLLAEGGTLYVYLGKTAQHSYASTTHIRTRNGDRKNLLEWLALQEGLSVVTRFADETNQVHLSLKIQVPSPAALKISPLELISIKEGEQTPPTRVYQER